MRAADKARLVDVYEVVVDTDTPGPAGDGTKVVRFLDKAEAVALAARSTCWGKQAIVLTATRPRQAIKRWGL